ncbi:MAG: hypothetical protein WCK67_01020 [bacterium]
MNITFGSNFVFKKPLTPEQKSNLSEELGIGKHYDSNPYQLDKTSLLTADRRDERVEAALEKTGIQVKEKQPAADYFRAYYLSSCDTPAEKASSYLNDLVKSETDYLDREWDYKHGD